MVVALAVAKSRATGLSLVAIVMIAMTGAVDTGMGAGARPTAGTAATGLVAVHVVPAVSVTEGIALGPPPAGDHVPRRTGVDAGDVAAELGPTIVASST